MQIIRTGANGSWELNKDALRAILLNDLVKDKPVAVVAVVGTFRQGKSFLLNFFLRYMYSYGRENWLGGPKERLKGFSWRGGFRRDTTGILVWDEVFLVPTGDGKELAVLLMDTQGTFDCESTNKQFSIVFALSILISSVHVYNLTGNISERDLQNLEFFAEYGRLAQKCGNQTPFQKLMFLVRDWYHIRDAPHGAIGGRKIIEKRLEIKASQPKELQQLRNRLKSGFSEIDGFLMPHPGLKVAEAGNFDGRVSDIDANFLRHLQDFVLSVLGAGNLQAKHINGEEVTCQELLSYTECYMKAFTGQELPEPKSVFEATAEANNLVAVAAAEDFYRKEMAQLLKLGLNAKNFEQAHAKLRDQAIDRFRSFPKMGGDMLEGKYVDMLEEKIEYLHSSFKLQMKSWANRIGELVLDALSVISATWFCLLSFVPGGIYIKLLQAIPAATSLMAYYALRFYRNYIRGQDSDFSRPRDNSRWSSRSSAETRDERNESRRRGAPTSAAWIVTPATLLALTAVFSFLSAVLDLAGLYSYGNFCSLLRAVCVFCLLLWAYVRVTGNWSNVGASIDAFAEVIYSSVST